MCHSLNGIDGIKPYAGEYMAAFSGNNADLPFVPEMLEVSVYIYP